MRFPLTQRLEQWQWRVLILVVYALPLLRGLKNVSWGVLFLLWMVARILGTRSSRPPQRLLGASLGWLLAGVWASLWAIEPDDSWKGVWDMLRATSMIWFIGDLLPNEFRRTALLRHVVLSTVAACLFAWFQHVPTLLAIVPDKDTTGIRYPVALQLRAVGHYNQSAMYLAMAWIVSLVAVLDPRVFPRRRRVSRLQIHRYSDRAAGLWTKTSNALFRPLGGIVGSVLAAGWVTRRSLLRHCWTGRFAVALTGLSLLGTTGRVPMLVSCLVAGWMIWQYGLPRWLMKLGLAVAVVAVLGVGASSTIRNRLFFRGSLHNRTSFWQAAVDEAKTRPWTGVGLNNFKNISLPSDDPRHMGTIDHAHNLYLNCLGQMGIPGLLALLCLLIGSGRMIWRWRPSQSAQKLWFCSAGGVWLVIVLAGVSNTPLHHEMAMLFFIVLGVVATRPLGLSRQALTFPRPVPLHGCG